MSFSPLIEKLIRALQTLPGVGPKSAQRMAFQLLNRNRDGGEYLARIVQEAMQKVGYCERCRLWCETQFCHICQNPHRDTTTLCIVESPMNVAAIEQAGSYDGLYFVLSGHLSPIDGIGPEEIGVPHLSQRLIDDSLKEVILAINPTVEGEATSFYLLDMIRSRDIAVTRLAQGIPLGGELEYVDGSTITRALSERSSLT